MRWIPQAAIGVFAVSFLAGSLAGCSDSAPVKHAQADAALAAANSLDFSRTNAEIQAIVRRLQLTTQPGVTGKVTLYSNGLAVAKYTVLGKLTSSSKRLTSPDDCGSSQCVNAPNDEGTYGNSDPYTYFFTPEKRFVQTNLPYVYETSAPDMPVKAAVPAPDRP